MKSDFFSFFSFRNFKPPKKRKKKLLASFCFPFSILFIKLKLIYIDGMLSILCLVSHMSFVCSFALKIPVHCIWWEFNIIIKFAFPYYACIEGSLYK